METKNELFCEVCDYTANRVSDFNKHIKTKKHYINYSIMVKNKQPIKSYECVCGKKFLHKHSVYRHRKQCEEYTKYIVEITNNNDNCPLWSSEGRMTINPPSDHELNERKKERYQI